MPRRDPLALARIAAALLALAALAHVLADGSHGFRPVTASPEDLPAVYQSRPLASLTPAFGVAARYDRRAASAIHADNRLGLDVSLALGLFRYVEVGAILPMRLALTGMPRDNGEGWEDGPSAALGDLHLVAKIALPGALRLPGGTGGGMAVTFDAELPTAAGEVRESWYRPGFVLDERFRHGLLLVLNVGAALRPATDTAPLAAALTVAAGAVVPIVPPWGLYGFASVDGDVPLAPLVDSWEDVRTEALFGMRWHGKSGWSVDVAGGAELRYFGSANFKLMARVVWMPRSSAEARARRAPPEPEPPPSSPSPSRSPSDGCSEEEETAGAGAHTGRHLLGAPLPGNRQLPAPPPSPEPCPPPETADTLRTDAYAGGFIALRGLAEDLREQIATARARKLVWTKKKFLAGEHTYDWNPTLDHLARILDGDVDRAITRGLSLAAAAHRREDDTTELASELDRTTGIVRIIAAYLACVRASQFALHDAPAIVLGEGSGFTNRLIEDAQPIGRELDRLLAGKVDRRSIDATIARAGDDIQRFFLGIEDGGTMLRLAGYIGLASLTLGLGDALLALNTLVRQLPAMLAGGGGGGLVAATGVYGGVTTAVALDIEYIVYGGTRGVANIMLLRSGGRGPVDMGKAGEAAAGIKGPKKRIPSLTGKAAYRVPDEVTRLTLTEVKNVLKLSYTRQLEDYLRYAKLRKLTFKLIVRRMTKISSELQKYIDDKSIMLEFLP